MNYLLGNISEAEREQIERRLLTDDEFFAQVGRLESELADEYAQGRLSAEERQRFEEHFLRSEEGREQAAFAVLLVEYARRAANTEDGDAPTNTGAASDDKAAPDTRAKPATQKVVPFAICGRAWANPYLRMAASLVIVAGLGLLIYRFFIYQSDVDKGLAALKQAYKGERPTEARITGFDYAPYSVTRGSNDKTGDTLEKERAERILLDAVHDRPGAESYYGLGKFYLAKQDYAQSITFLKKALETRSTDAQIHADLGAALLEKGKTDVVQDDSGTGFKEFDESLSHLDKATELDHSLLEPLFNRALVLVELKQVVPAKEAFEIYLEKDRNSRWADDAKEKLRYVEEQIKKTSQTKAEIYQDFLNAYDSGNEEACWMLVSSSYARTGNVILEQLIDEYLESLEQNRSANAQQKLQAIFYIGRLSVDKAGDNYISDLAKFYQSVSPEQRHRLIESRQLMKSAHDGWGRIPVKENLELFLKANQVYTNVKDFPETLLTQYWLAMCYLRNKNTEKVILTMSSILQKCEERAYKWLQARSLYTLSGSYFNNNQLSLSLKNGLQAFLVSDTIHDTVGALNSLGAIVEYYRSLGNYQQSLYYIQKLLHLSASISPDPVQACRNSGFLASAFLSMGLYSLAIEYQKETVRVASVINHPSISSINLALLGTIYAYNHNYLDAVSSTERALGLADTFSDEPSARDIRAHCYLQLGHIHRLAKDNEKAVSNYNQAIELYEGLNFPTRLYESHKGRLFCYIAQKNKSLIQEEIDTTLQIAETYRVQITEEENRNNFFENEQNLYDSIIEYTVKENHNAEKAFEYSELSKARSLLERIYSEKAIPWSNSTLNNNLQSTTPLLSPTEIQRDLPTNTQILQYSILDNDLIIWVITKTDIFLSTQNISDAQLSSKVINYLQAISTPGASKGSGAVESAKELFDVLISPVESYLDSQKQICVVPDKSLNFLPFNALISSKSERYLIEQYHFIVAPSANVFITCSKEAQIKNNVGSEKLLGVGNPAFDRKAYSSLPDLPSAAKEIEEISQYYKSPQVLVGSKAKLNAVKDAINQADVIHFALHFVRDEQMPMRSKLIFAKEFQRSTRNPKSEDTLSAYEIYLMTLNKPRLVVLSACQTGTEHYYQGEGMLNLVRPFLAAGVPTVIASFWPVDTEATKQLMANFHKNRRQSKLSTSEALRYAQLDMLHHSVNSYQQPFYWASFAAIGGMTLF